MRLLFTTTITLSLAATALAQRPIASPNLEVTNFRGVVNGGGTSPNGGFYPAGGTYPPSYGLPSGVIPGSRAWTYTPELRHQGGHVAGKWLTITGMTQAINLGGDTLVFPGPNHYQFATGIGPTQTVTTPEGKRHATSGADVVKFPAGTIMPTNAGIIHHTFTLTTPVAVPKSDLCLFVEYKGGEYYFSTTNGQTVGCDWRGGKGALGGSYYGFAEGTPFKITTGGSSLYRGQIGMIVEEPIFTATGFHANQYSQAPAMPNEDYVGLSAAWSDWTISNPNASLFFHFSAGSNFASGSATVLANLSRMPFQFSIPSPFGNVLILPSDPFFTLFADAGLVMNLDGVGEYTAGPNTPLQIPQIPAGMSGMVLKTQGLVFDPLTNKIQLTNSSSITVR